MQGLGDPVEVLTKYFSRLSLPSKFCFSELTLGVP